MTVLVEPHQPSRARYNAGCRCADCIEANRAYAEQRRRAQGQQPLQRGCSQPHGSLARYQHHGCRCEPCRSAATAYHFKFRQHRFAYFAEHGLPASVEHGASAYNNWGCRCSVCTAANSQRARDRVA